MSKSDVVVIGNGVAGLMAALVSADEGKKVTLLSYGAGTFPLNSGVASWLKITLIRRLAWLPFRIL